MSRNVVITGLGVVAPNGSTVDAYWTALKNGDCAIRQREFFADDLSVNQICAPVDDVDDRIKGLGKDGALSLIHI